MPKQDQPPKKEASQAVEKPKAAADPKAQAAQAATAACELGVAKALDQAQTDAQLSEVQAKLGIEAAASDDRAELSNYLAKYLETEDLDGITYLEAGNLPAHFQEHYQVLNDPRLEAVTVAVVPDKVWAKGSQPSESHAERQLMLIKESYFQETEKPDEVAWINHEFAHCKKFLDSANEAAYFEAMQTSAYPDIASEYNYPNNLVEAYTFRKQFEFLLNKGKKPEDIVDALKEEYPDDLDQQFFSRLLEEIEAEQTIITGINQALIERSVVTADEVENLSSTAYEEFYVRFADYFEELPNELPEDKKRKARMVLGLEKLPPAEQRETEIQETVAQMRDYLAKMQQEIPYVKGMIICGSRMDKDKIPLPTSDYDIVIIMDNGYEAGWANPEQEAVTKELLAYVNTHGAGPNSDIEVGINEYYNLDQFSTAIDSPTDRTKLIWGWKSEAMKYLGENEDATNSELAVKLNAGDTQALKHEIVSEKKAKIQASL